MGHVVAIADERHRQAGEFLEMFAQCQQVRHRLAGVAVIGQAVDDRDGRPFGQAEDFIVLEGAGHDSIDHAGENAGHVLHRLALAESDFLFAEEKAVSAQVRHADGEADAGAEAGLLEDHRQGFSGQDRIVAAGFLVLLFQFRGDVETVFEILERGVGDGDEMTHN